MVAKSMGVTTTSLHPTDGLALDPSAARRPHTAGGAGDRAKAKGQGPGSKNGSGEAGDKSGNDIVSSQ